MTQCGDQYLAEVDRRPDVLLLLTCQRLAGHPGNHACSGSSGRAGEAITEWPADPGERVNERARIEALGATG